jgi:hypothetical protein
VIRRQGEGRKAADADVAINPLCWNLALSFVAALVGTHAVCAQDLSPRAYVITPVHSNVIILSNGYFSGDLDINGAFPITDASGSYNVPIFSYYHSFRLFGRSANATGVLPYGVGNFEGESTVGKTKSVYRSGLLDAGARISVNLKGGPAMELPQFSKWKQKTLVGVSLRVIAPTGQYSQNLLINWGTNHWSFKPEIGYSHRFKRNWLVDTYAGVWFFTTNPAFFSLTPPPQSHSVSPMGSFEGHLSYDLKPRLWVSLDGNFWFGGAATSGGVLNPNTSQLSSRIGVTGSLPLSRHQAFKVSYSDGTYYRVGGDYKNVTVAWQYSWFGKPN